MKLGTILHCSTNKLETAELKTILDRIKENYPHQYGEIVHILLGKAEELKKESRSV